VASRSGAPPGLATPSVVGGGVIIGFATAPGEEAGDHSPFTTALLKELPQPGVEIQQALTRVKADVYSATKGEQEPWHNSDQTIKALGAFLRSTIRMRRTCPMPNGPGSRWRRPTETRASRSLMTC
jgi:uncharacterized caspase-like protein